MKKGIYNILFGIIGQIIILALGILVPRFLLQSYGDEANGLINAIGQVFTYLALIEAGVGQAALQALYGPIVRKEYKETNKILSATQQMFRRLTKIYMLVVTLIAFVYPLFINVKDTQSISIFGSYYWAIFLIIVIQGGSNAVTFYFVSTLRQLLISDGYNYIIVNITTVIRVLTSVLRIVLINMRINLVALQLVYLGISVIEVAIYKFVLKKKYTWLNMDEMPGEGVLNQRNAFVVHEACNVIFSSTDVLVLSLFCDLKVASIYAIYNLVYSAINTLINQVHGGCFYILGQIYNRDSNEYVKVHDTYDTYYIAFVFALTSTVYICILPFVRIYTAGITDVNYVDSNLPLLFCAIQLLSCCRITSSNLIKIAGHAKRTIMRAVAEAVINLGVSLILVRFIGIYGVLIGTIVALVYRTNDMIIYANSRILNRLPVKTYKIVFVNVIMFGVTAFLGQKLNKIVVVNSFLPFFIYAGLVCISILLLFFLVNSIVNKSSWIYLRSKINSRFHRGN